MRHKLEGTEGAVLIDTIVLLRNQLSSSSFSRRFVETNSDRRMHLKSLILTFTTMVTRPKLKAYAHASQCSNSVGWFPGQNMHIETLNKKKLLFHSPITEYLWVLPLKSKPKSFFIFENSHLRTNYSISMSAFLIHFYKFESFALALGLHRRWGITVVKVKVAGFSEY